MRHALPLLLLAFAACADAATSPAVAPARPSPWILVGGSNEGNPPPPPALLAGSFDADGAATTSDVSTSFDLSANRSNGSITFPSTQPAGTSVSPGANLFFHNDGTTTGTGTITLTVTNPNAFVPVGSTAASLAAEAASAKASKGNSGKSAKVAGTVAAADAPRFTVVIDLPASLSTGDAQIIPSCFAPSGPASCVIIRVTNARLVDALGYHSATITGTFVVSSPTSKP